MFNVSYSSKSTRYEIAVFDAGPDSEALALVNFGTCMRLPEEWREGIEPGYVAEKLRISEVDAQEVLTALGKLAAR